VVKSKQLSSYHGSLRDKLHSEHAPVFLSQRNKLSRLLTAITIEQMVYITKLYSSLFQHDIDWYDFVRLCRNQVGTTLRDSTRLYTQRRSSVSVFHRKTHHTPKCPAFSSSLAKSWSKQARLYVYTRGQPRLASRRTRRVARLNAEAPVERIFVLGHKAYNEHRAFELAVGDVETFLLKLVLEQDVTVTQALCMKIATAFLFSSTKVQLYVQSVATLPVPTPLKWEGNRHLQGMTGSEPFATLHIWIGTQPVLASGAAGREV
jgi:hypothetical protein